MDTKLTVGQLLLISGFFLIVWPFLVWLLGSFLRAGRGPMED